MSAAVSPTDADLHELFMQSSIAYKLQHSNVIIDGMVKLDFAKYPYIPDIIDGEARLTTILKGAQMGLSIACIMLALERAKLNKYRGIGYFFPSEGEVTDFSQARFDPMMEDNHELWGQHVENTNKVSLKKVGGTHLYFRGIGQRGTGTEGKSTSKQKSIPLDGIILDERDEMADLRVDAIKHRLDASSFPWQIDLSTPTLPGFGVDYDYQLSNKSTWYWKCQRCNEWNCLELRYPDCIIEPTNKDPYYDCSKCRKPLERTTGEWVAEHPDKEDHVGYFISQLSSPTKTAMDIVIASDESVATGRRREFENQVLAKAYAEVDEQLTDAQLNAMLTDESRPLKHAGPCAMGIDPGKIHWYEVRYRVNETDSVCIDRGKCDSYEELSRIWKKYGCESGVIDVGFDPSAVTKFCDDHPGCFAGRYTAQKTSDADWNHQNRTVNIGRTFNLDKAHDAIVTGRVKHVRKDQFWIDYFLPQMKNLKRATLIVNQLTKSMRAEWVVTGGKKNDHLRHADAYCNLALEQCGLVRSVDVDLYKRQPKKDFVGRTWMSN